MQIKIECSINPHHPLFMSIIIRLRIGIKQFALNKLSSMHNLAKFVNIKMYYPLKETTYL